MNFSIARAIRTLAGGLFVSLLVAAPSSAQILPNWQPERICVQDSAKGQCLLFEQRAQNDITASWNIIPKSVRSTCLKVFKPPLEPSWRILGDCIEIANRRALTAARMRREDATLIVLRGKAAAASARERQRIEKEEASFMSRLAEQRRKDLQAAARKAAADKSAAVKADAERQRIQAEEATFMALLAEQQRADHATRQRTLASKQASLNAKAKQAEAQRIAAEEASFMKSLAAQRRTDAEATKRKVKANK